MRADLARYVSPDVAEALARRGGTAFGDPATRTVAVLFADIVGFTKLTETLSPERTFALLRSFQERSSAIVFKHGGTLDKYLGDGFMATFGSIGLQPDAPARALACAFELQQEIDRWSRKRSGRGADPLSCLGRNPLWPCDGGQSRRQGAHRVYRRRRCRERGEQARGDHPGGGRLDHRLGGLHPGGGQIRSGS